MPFSKYFFLSFLIGLPLIFISANTLADLYKNYQQTHFFSRQSESFTRLFSADVPAESIQLNIKNPQDAKQAHDFWLHPEFDDEMGIALDARNSDFFLQQMYPGYSQLQQRAEFWNNYFAYSFNYDSMLPSLNAGTPFVRLLKMPWAGCFDLHRMEGSDILVFGSSEVTLAVSTPLLHEKLGGRVLMCARAGFLVQNASVLSEILGGTGHRAKKAIWGYSFWNAYLRSGTLPEFAQAQGWDFLRWAELNPKATLSSKDQLKTWLAPALPSKNKITSFFDYKFNQFFTVPDWSKVFGHSVEELKKLHQNAQKIKTQGFAQDTDEEGFFFDPKRENELSQMAAKARPYYKYLDGISEKDCDIGQAQQEFQQALSAFQKVADELYIYLTPVTPLQMQSTPACFRAAVRKMLQSAESAHVHIKTQDWDAYALDWKDFALSEGPDFKARLDINHVNDQGAAKVTSALVDWIQSR